MNTYSQLTESMSHWWGSQNQMFEKWLKAGPNFGGKDFPMGSLVTETVDIYEKAIEDSLMVQAVWSAQTRESIDKQAYLPKEFKDATIQMLEFNDQWREERERMWHSWFETIKAFCGSESVVEEASSPSVAAAPRASNVPEAKKPAGKQTDTPK